MRFLSLSPRSVIRPGVACTDDLGFGTVAGVNAGSVMNGEVEHNAPAKAGFESTDAELPPGSMARPPAPPPARATARARAPAAT